MRKTYLMLGRLGDVINILPAIEYEAKQNNYKPKLICQKDYVDVLDGCSDYVEKIVYRGNFKAINQAIIFARNNFPKDKIVNCAIYGDRYSIKKECSSFQRESWKLSECPIAWGRLPLNFPNRDKEREEKILRDFNIDKIGDRPIIVTALKGHSSPFEFASQLFGILTEKLCAEQNYYIVDISDYRAERFYDLLALYEKASVLIATDSAPLHLANAIPHLPVISLISDLKDEWHQSSWRKNHILRLLYSEVPGKLDEIVKAVTTGPKYQERKIHLVTSHKDKLFGEDWRRFLFAQNTWDDEIEVKNSLWEKHYYRTTSIPKVWEMINPAVVSAKDDDIIMICNSDISFVPGITGWILHEVERHQAAYFHRRDFVRLDSPLISESEVARGKFYPGSDTFVFTKKWWIKYRDIYPDFYFAREGYDMVLRNLIKATGGSEIYNAIAHEKHKSYWESKEGYNCAENIHNRKLASEWLERYAKPEYWNDWKFSREQLKYGI